jgi:glutamyl-tRNA reductase
VAAVVKARRYRRLLMVDLAVPRDIEPGVNGLENVYAFDVDDIQGVLAENSAARAAEATKAESIVAEEVARFVRSKAVRDGMPVLAQLRTRAEQIKRAELERTFANLRPGVTEDELRRSMEALATAIVNKLLHQPTARLRAVGQEDPGHQLVGAVAELFGLNGGADAGGEAGEEPGASSGPGGREGQETSGTAARLVRGVKR